MASTFPQDASTTQGEETPPLQPSSTAQERNRVTVPSACIACRSKHLKCDGLNPCTRCSSNSLECVYVRSRRGFKGPRKKDRAPSASASNSSAVSCPLVHPGQTQTQTPSANGSTFSNGLATPPNQTHQPLPHVTGADASSFLLEGQALAPLGLIQYNLQCPPSDLRERCFEAFFHKFHASHPFLLPRHHLLTLLKAKPMEHLEAAMRYAGSFYIPQANTEEMGLEAERSIYRVNCPRDGFRVQAMLILAIGLDGFTDREKALRILTEAEDLAMDLGMHTRDFASLNGADQRVFEESWRRTWWELFIVDGMIAAVHQQSTFRLNDMSADVPLPCEENEYASGDIPPSRTLFDFDDESFSGEDISFSSFAYRIAALRCTGRVLQLGNITFANDPAIDRVDAQLVNWKLHLPESKKTFITIERKLDEMLFQAHMIIEATTILLHRDHSQLDSSAAQRVTSCAPYRQIVPGQQYNTHAAKIIASAQNISKLITLPTTMTTHTLFFTCVVTLASIVHLSVWSAMMPIIQDGDIKQQLRLNIGALRELWQIWPSAGQAFGQVKGVAQEIFAAKKAAIDNGFWTDLTHDEIMSGLTEDERIMEEFSDGPFTLQV